MYIFGVASYDKFPKWSQWEECSPLKTKPTNYVTRGRIYLNGAYPNAKWKKAFVDLELKNVH